MKASNLPVSKITNFCIQDNGGNCKIQKRNLVYGSGIFRRTSTNSVKVLGVRQDLFEGTVDAKELRTKDTKETITFITVITKK